MLVLTLLLATAIGASASSSSHTVLKGCYSTPPLITYSSTSFSHDMSYASDSSETPITSGSNRYIVKDPPSCFNACPTDLGTLVSIKSTSSDNVECICSEGGEVEEAEECGEASWYIYEVVAASSPSAVSSEKRGKTEQQGKRRLITGLCDGDQRPCKVPKMEASYECIDIVSSVTSCGGCLAGEYLIGGVNQTVMGIDCTSLPGVDSSQVSCTSGACLINTCLDGFELVKGRCVRS